MSRIPPASPPANSEIADMMEYWTRIKGYAPNAWQTMLRRPQIFLAYRNLHKAVMMDGGEVPKGLKFMIAEVVSNAAGCTYCTAHNAENAAHVGGVSEEKVAELCRFASSPNFTPAEKAALALAEAAGSHPPTVTDAHFDELKRYFSDDAIVEVVSVISLLGWLNRWNQTLGTILEPPSVAFAEEYLAPGGWTPGLAAPRQGG